MCGFYHPRSWECPEMQQKGKLRIAIDMLKHQAFLTDEQKSQRKKFLQAKLAALSGR